MKKHRGSVGGTHGGGRDDGLGRSGVGAKTGSIRGPRGGGRDGGNWRSGDWVASGLGGLAQSVGLFGWLVWCRCRITYSTSLGVD